MKPCRPSGGGASLGPAGRVLIAGQSPGLPGPGGSGRWGAWGGALLAGAPGRSRKRGDGRPHPYRWRGASRRYEATPPPSTLRFCRNLSKLRECRKLPFLRSGVVRSGAVAHINQEVPEDLHRAAKAAAALRGVSLKEFVNEALRAAVALATAEAAAAEPARKGAPR